MPVSDLGKGSLSKHGFSTSVILMKIFRCVVSAERKLIRLKKIVAKNCGSTNLSSNRVSLDQFKACSFPSHRWRSSIFFEDVRYDPRFPVTFCRAGDAIRSSIRAMATPTASEVNLYDQYLPCSVRLSQFISNNQ